MKKRNERSTSRMKSIINPVIKRYQASSMSTTISKALGSFRKRVSGLMLYIRMPKALRSFGIGIFANLFSKYFQTPNRGDGLANKNSYEKLNEKVNQSHVDTQMTALYLQSEDLSQRVSELENYYHLDPTIGADDSWKACINQLDIFRASYKKLVASLDMAALSESEIENLSQLNKSLASMKHVMNSDQVTNLVAKLQGSTPSIDKVVRLMSNPWVVSQLDDDASANLREKVAELNQRSIENTARTLMDKATELFLAIPTDEFYHLKSKDCPKLSEYTEFFNQMSMMVAKNVLSYQSPAERSAALAYWAEVVLQCTNNENYYSAMAVNTGLYSSNLSRLAASNEGVPEYYENVKEVNNVLYNPSDTFLGLRDVMEKASQGVVPFIAPYRTLTDRSNEHHGSVKDMFYAVIENYEKLGSDTEVEVAAAVWEEVVKQLDNIDKMLEKEALSSELISAYEQLKLMRDQALEGDYDQVHEALPNIKAQVKQDKLGDFPEALHCNKFLVDCQEKLAQHQPINDANIALITEISALETGDKAEMEAYKTSKRVEPNPADIAPSKMFENIDRVTNMETTKRSLDSRVGKLNNPYLRDCIIKHAQVIDSEVTDKLVAAVNDTSVNLVSDTKLDSALRAIGVELDHDTVRAVNDANKQICYHQRIRSETLKEVTQDVKLKSSTAGLFGGKSTKRRLNELSKLSKNGDFDRILLEYKLAKLGVKGGLTDEQYLKLIDEKQASQRETNVKGS